MTVLLPIPSVFPAIRPRPTDCLLEAELTEKCEDSWQWGKGDLHVALKEGQRVGSVTAEQLGPAEVVHRLKTVLTQPKMDEPGGHFAQGSLGPCPSCLYHFLFFSTGPQKKFSTITLWLGCKCLVVASLIDLALGTGRPR